MVVLAGDRSFTHALSWGDDLVLGRDPASDIAIDDPSVEPRHARLRVGDPSLLEDLGGESGTIIGETHVRAGHPVALPFHQTARLGAITIILQPRSSAAPVRRIHSHDYFEGRLAEECARAKRRGGMFALLRIYGHPAESHRVVGETIARMIRATDVLATYAPGDFEVLLADATSEGAKALSDSMISRCAELKVWIRATVTCFPHDGADADPLLAAMRAPAAEPRPGDEPVVVGDGAMKHIYELVARVANSSISVLLLGETGVGKEVVAEAIHEQSARARKPMLRLSCVALSDSLLESELFGHEKGAFTGAHQAKPGLIESADGGTVFLDEVGEMPASTQAKLLRVIEQRELTRVGSLTPRSVDVRFVAATNRDLEVEVQRGTFRQDLYYRLNGITVVIPPLRERRAEILPLAEHFLASACAEASRPPVTLSPRVRDYLLDYAWPGNVRELRNVISRGLLLCTGNTVEPEHLPLEKMRETLAVSDNRRASTVDGAESLTRWSRTREPAELAAERERIRELLERHGGNQLDVARALGISRRTLTNRMDQYRLPRPRKRR